ncbi:hypothetical protein SOPP22_02185 [Shewanella sp. OPT22]|nr:hypothetical protein SOPP22_02185 [Shewanella sp. OPT22]
MEFLNEIFTSENYGLIAAVAVVTIFLWFLPALLALFFNRKHFKLILIACIPAGLSVIAWSALMLWATTGKVASKYTSKFKAPKIKT